MARRKSRDKLVDEAQVIVRAWRKKYTEDDMYYILGIINAMLK